VLRRLPQCLLQSIGQCYHEAVFLPRLRKTLLRNGFVFVEVPRTSTTSVREELAQKFGPLYAGNFRDRAWHGVRGIRQNTPAGVIRAQLGASVWQSLFSFALVRNPWDRMVSLYHLRRDTLHDLPPEVTFREYILKFNSPCYGDWCSPFARPMYYLAAHEWVSDGTGQVIVSYVGRYETRDRDLATIGRRIGFPELGGSLRLNCAPRSHAHYSRFYDDDTREVVARVFRRDVELFDYRFDDRRDAAAEGTPVGADAAVVAQSGGS